MYQAGLHLPDMPPDVQLARQAGEAHGIQVLLWQRNCNKRFDKHCEHCLHMLTPIEFVVIWFGWAKENVLKEFFQAQIEVNRLNLQGNMFGK